MKGIATLCLLVALTETVVGFGWFDQEKNDARTKIIHELIGDEHIAKSTTPYAEESESMKIYIRRIRDAYKKYVKKMWNFKAAEKIMCANKKVTQSFLVAKSELSILVYVYMTVKNIQDNGQLAVEIDLGKGHLAVPMSKIVLPPAEQPFFVRLFSTVTCHSPPAIMPEQDLIFYVVEYKHSRWAPGVEDAETLIRQAPPKRRDESHGAPLSFGEGPDHPAPAAPAAAVQTQKE